MVLLHLLRCQRYLWRGLRDRVRVSRVIYGVAPLPVDSPTAVVPSRAVRKLAAFVAARGSTPATTTTAPTGAAVRSVVWPWSRSLPADPAFARFLAQPITVPVYCGLRMTDELGHVNNAKYLEITEFARWHQIAFLGIGDVMAARKIAFVVSDVSITYQREIGPCTTVWVRTRFVLPPGAPRSDKGVAAGTRPDTGPAAVDKKRFFVEHEIWSADGHKLHAAMTLSAALLGPVEYEQELAQRYGGDGAAAKPVRPRTTLICDQVLADVCGFASTTEVHQLFASVEHVCTPSEGVGEAAAAVGAVDAVDEKVAAEDVERTDRIRTLAHVWKTTRNALRRKMLIPKSPKGD